MDIRRSSLTADRRRRLLSEESGLAPTRDDFAKASTSSASPARRTKRAEKERYTPDASWDQQPRITDLIPRRKLTISGLFLLGGLCIAGLIWLYALMPKIAAKTTDGRIAAFDLDGEGSLAAYFSSLVLMFAGWTAILIFSLRRHRLDDYRARYRIWLWAALVWFTMSIDESGSLHEGFKEFMAYLSGSRLYGDGSLWWVMAYGAVLGVIGLRLLWDMRSYRPSTIALLLSAACFAVAVIVQLQLVMPERGAQAVMVEEGCEMAGAMFLLLAMALHARFIIFDIEGKYKQAKSTAKSQTDTDATSESDSTDEGVDEQETTTRRGSGLLPWRLVGRKRAMATSTADEGTRESKPSRSSSAATETRLSRRERKAEAIAAKKEAARQEATKKQAEKSASEPPKLTRLERKEVARQKKRELAEQRLTEKAEAKQRRLDEAQAKPKRAGFWRRKPKDEEETATSKSDSSRSTATATKKITKPAQAETRPTQASKTSTVARTEANNGDGEKRPLTKAERKALRRERRRREREDAEE